MANAVPVHAEDKAPAKKKPLSKDAQKIKQELADIAAQNEPKTTKLPDGTVRVDR